MKYLEFVITSFIDFGGACWYEAGISIMSLFGVLRVCDMSLVDFGGHVGMRQGSTYLFCLGYLEFVITSPVDFGGASWHKAGISIMSLFGVSRIPHGLWNFYEAKRRPILSALRWKRKLNNQNVEQYRVIRCDNQIKDL